MYCSNCGTQFEGQYCPACGKPANAANPAGVPPPVSSPSAPGLPSNIASVICYLVPIIGPVVFLLLAPYNRDSKVRFDAWQALGVHVTYIVLNMIIAIFADVSWRTSALLHQITALAYFILIIYLIVKALQKEKVVLPYVGDFANKQK